MKDLGEMTKIAFLIHDPEAPSCRYRVLQFIPYLKRMGMDVSTHLFKHKFLDKWSFCNTVGGYDIIFIQRKLFSPIEFLYIRQKAKKIIYDFDDAIMYRSPRSKNPYSFSRRIKFALMMRRVDGVIAGNQFLKSEALPYNSNVVIIPTSIDLSQYTLKKDFDHSKPITIGWFGSRSGLGFLRNLIPIFENIFKKQINIQLKIVCSEFIDSANVPIIKKKWSLAEEVEDLKSFDIGVMPLADDLWSKGKCGLKILQYNSVGIPAVCTPVGVNREIVKDGVNGFWAQNEAQWEDRLLKLIHERELRKEMGLKGREIVERNYSIEANAPRLLSTLMGATEKI
ncbi:MAG: glycosyltransferase family 4 protein [Deltaproteobacteria bacterium]|nr:glycosyltransferase family 4 protein [Deltaproteobacteria bacterium]